LILKKKEHYSLKKEDALFSLDGISAQLQGDSLAAAIRWLTCRFSYLRAIRNIDLLFESLEKNNTTKMDHHHISNC
jgi:hypothetical protein